MKNYFEIINKPFLTAGSINISILTLLLFIPVVIVAQYIGKLVGKLVKASLRKGKISDIIQFRIVKIVRYGVTAIALFIGLTALGINLSSIAVILGALGIGVGFGLQTLISNFSAGLVIFFTGPIKEGDRVTIGDVDGFEFLLRIAERRGEPRDRPETRLHAEAPTRRQPLEEPGHFTIFAMKSKPSTAVSFTSTNSPTGADFAPRPSR